MVFTHLVTYIVDDTLESGAFTTSNFPEFISALEDLFQCENQLEAHGKSLKWKEDIVGQLDYSIEGMGYIFDRMIEIIGKEEKAKMFSFIGDVKVMTNSFDNSEIFFTKN